jgi:hypothetical protein
MRWIIAAPSCVGKSTFISNNDRISELTGLKDQPLVMPAFKYIKRNLDDPAYLHYCISFGSRLIWPNLKSPKKAIVLVSSRSTMVTRAVKRRDEHKAGANVARPPMTCVRRHTDETWKELYSMCIEDLNVHETPYVLIDTEKEGYPEIEDITKLDWWDNEQESN